LTWLLRNKLAVGVSGAFLVALIGWLIAAGLFSEPPNVSGDWTVKYSQLGEVDTLTLTEQKDGSISGSIDDGNIADTTPVTGRITKDGQITITATGYGTAIWSGTLKGNEIKGTFDAPSTPHQTFDAKKQ
jgi:hypothetical protein